MEQLYTDQALEHTFLCESDGWCYGCDLVAKCCVCGAGLFKEHTGTKQHLTDVYGED